jgi:uncharacterized protein with PQ loop repeat
MIVFCTLYYVLSYIQIIPQIIKLLRIKLSEDYSLYTLCIEIIAISFWTLYLYTSSQNTIGID